MSDAWEAPNRIDIIHRVNAENPGLIHNPHAFTAKAVCALAKDDPTWGRNGKRGNRNDPSEDAAAWPNAAVPWGCSIVDIIGGAGGNNPQPAWIDQTRRTHQLGTTGVVIPVDCASEPEPGPGPGPDPTPEPPPTTPPIDNAIEVAVLNRKLDLILVALDDAKNQQAADTDQIGRWMVEQAQGVVAAITGALGGIGSVCRYRSPFRGGVSDVSGIPGDAED
jgi:hypothetical protein